MSMSATKIEDNFSPVIISTYKIYPLIKHKMFFSSIFFSCVVFTVLGVINEQASSVEEGKINRLTIMKKTIIFFYILLPLKKFMLETKYIFAINNSRIYVKLPLNRELNQFSTI